jgi:succinate dehydrogenase/fumarate reductase flavoprotein subunit
VLEKAPQPGGNTSVSSGFLRIPSDAGKAAQFLQAVGSGSINNETARMFAETWVELEGWLTDRGAQFTVTEVAHRWAGALAGIDALDKAILMDRQDGRAGVGRDLFAFLAGIVKKQESVEVLVNTPARRLIQNGASGEIRGVLAGTDEKEIRIQAKKAVILASGGFEANRKMLATYIEGAPVPVAVSGTPYNTGDGITMAAEVGADLWHMNAVEWGRAGFKPPELPAAFWLDPKSQAWVNVNKQGSRFRNESESYAHTKKHLEVFHFDRQACGWPNHPWYLIFDEKVRSAGPVILLQRAAGRAPFVTYNLARELYSWSADNRDEIEKGWILAGDTLAELAQKTDVDPAGLEQTVGRHNRFCEKGLDEDFGRSAKRLAPINEPPYYAMECTVNIINTQGGPRRNFKSQVMDPYGKPIPRLYAVGELGSLYGYLYPGGCNLPECIVSGILAGRAALAEAI